MHTLQGEASEQKTSLNTLVNQIFSKHVEWDMLTQKYGFVNFPQEFYKEIIESTAENALVAGAEEAGKRFREYLIFSFNQANIETLILALRRSGRYSGLGILEVKESGPKRYLVIHHNLGRKHSLFIKTLLESAITSVAQSPTKSEVADGLVAIEFESRREIKAVLSSEA